MFALRTLASVAVAACLSASALADAPLIFCVGSGCGGGGPRDYAYLVDAISYPMMEFRVGTSDLYLDRYTDIILPEGWNFTVEPEGMSHACGLFAPHGEISDGPCYSLTAGAAVWWTEDPAYAVEYFTFGFNHPWKAEDVGWTLLTRREGDPPEWYEFFEFWDALVGEGMGPVHGPFAPGCPADVNQDGIVDVLDLLAVLAAWGTSGDVPEDINHDGIVDVMDLLEVLGAWGPCPPADFIPAQLAGNPLEAFPHFEYVTAFNYGTPVHVALDPALIPGGDKTADVYITKAKTPAEWFDDVTLVDVRGAPQTEAFNGATIQDNTFLLTDGDDLSAEAGIDIGRGYDLVSDFNQNGVLDPGDFIDGHDVEAGFYVVGDLVAPGPLETAVSDYAVAGPVPPYNQQHTVYPADIASMDTLPLVVISHHSGVLQTWYEYLQQHLASYGYIVMAHKNNTIPGIETAAASTLDNTDAMIGQQDSIGGGVLNGHIDSQRIVFIGHSRGGEGVVRAYDRLYKGNYTPDHFGVEDVVLVSAIAPTNMLGPYKSHPHGVTFHFLCGAEDEYVTGCPTFIGNIPFTIYELAEQTRHSTYIHGAEHTDFYEYPPGPRGPISPDTTRQITKAIYLALLKHHVDGSYPARDFLWRQWEAFRPLSLADVQTTVDHEYKIGDEGNKFVIDDYEFGDALNVSSSGGAVTFTVNNPYEGPLQDTDGEFTWTPSDPMNGMTRAWSYNPVRGVVFDWSEGDKTFYEFEIQPKNQDFVPYTYLSLRACQGTRHPETIAELGDLTFTVTLRDTDGSTSSINIGVYGGGIEEPYQRDGCGEGVGWQNEFETIRIRLRDFLHNDSGLDLAHIAAVRLDFGGQYGSAQGRLGLDDVELTRD